MQIQDVKEGLFKISPKCAAIWDQAFRQAMNEMGVTDFKKGSKGEILLLPSEKPANEHFARLVKVKVTRLKKEQGHAPVSAEAADIERTGPVPSFGADGKAPLAFIELPALISHVSKMDESALPKRLIIYGQDWDQVKDDLVSMVPSRKTYFEFKVHFRTTAEFAEHIKQRMFRLGYSGAVTPAKVNDLFRMAVVQQSHEMELAYRA